MNELLQKHGCSNVFTIPEGLRELMADITREVLRTQPVNICEFISNYLSALLITREHGIVSAKILEDLCDCRPTVSEHLLHLGIEQDTAVKLEQVIKETIEELIPEKDTEGTYKVQEIHMLKKILLISTLDADRTTKICQIARNAYREYWYKKQSMEKHFKTGPQEPWEIAAEHTVEIYKKTKPSYNELMRATRKIQSAYRGYHYRRHLLEQLKLKPKHHHGPKKALPGPPLDIAESREIDLGPVMKLDVKKQDDVDAMLSRHADEKLSLKYDPNKTIAHVNDDEKYLEKADSRMITAKTVETPITEEGGPRQPFYRDSQDSKPYQGPKTERVSDTPQPPKQFRSESTISQYGGTRKKAISIIDKPKEFLIEARETKQVFYEAPKAVEVETIYDADTVPKSEETPVAEVPEDINDDVSTPTASVPTEPTADDTDVDVDEAVDDGVEFEDNQIHEYE